MTFAKATILVLDGPAIDPSRGLPKVFPVEFNPTDLTFNKSAQIAEIAIPGLDAPILQFVRGQSETLKLELFFDVTDLGVADVRALTTPFYQLVKAQPRTHAPPRILFTWGAGLSFRAIVESVERKFTLFRPDGVPLRAQLVLSLREYKTLEEQLAELNLQSSDHTKERVVVEGETLASIAQGEFGDYREWRRIADANPDVFDPMSLRPGTVLRVPPSTSTAVLV
jgi:nucleoid-associated protein YgaU